MLWLDLWISSGVRGVITQFLPLQSEEKLLAQELKFFFQRYKLFEVSCVTAELT